MILKLNAQVREFGLYSTYPQIINSQPLKINACLGRIADIRAEAGSQKIQDDIKNLLDLSREYRSGNLVPLETLIELGFAKQTATNDNQRSERPLQSQAPAGEVGLEFRQESNLN